MRLIITILICFLSVNSFAEQEVITLEELIEKTLENNPEIRASRAAYEASAKRPSQEGTLPNPTIGVKYRNAGFDEITLGDEQMTHLEFSFRQDIPFPGKLSMREEIAETGSEVQEWKAEAVKRRVLAELKKTYYQWFLVNKSIDITEKNKDLLGKLTEIAGAKYEVGKGIQQDVTRAQVEMSKFIEKLEILNSREKIIRARLRDIANIPGDESLGTPADQLKQTTFTLQMDEIKELARENAPVLNARDRQIVMNKGSLELAKKDLYPDISLGTAYANRGFGNDSLDGIWEIGVGFKVPLYFLSREKPAIDEAALNLAESRHRYDDTANEINYLINEYYLTAETAENLMDLYENGIIPQAEMSLDSSISAYQVGKIDFLTLLDNMVTLFTFELEYYRKIVEYQTALANIEETAGIEITGSDGTDIVQTEENKDEN